MNNREHPLIAAIKRTLADPGATRRMVLKQGKAFVYLSIERIAKHRSTLLSQEAQV